MGTIVVGIIAYVLGVLSGVMCISCTLAGKRMDEKIKALDEKENE